MITKRELNLLKGSLPKLIRRIAIPASIGFFFMTMYNVVDTFFAGMISTDALAAMSMSFPLFIVILALGNGVGIGASALVSNNLGAGKEKEAKRFVNQSITFGLIISVFASGIGILSAESIFSVLNATPEVMLLAKQYTYTIFAGTLFFVMNHIINGFLMATGDTKSFRNILMGGFLLNILLDPLFLFGWFGLPKMGVLGIALATVIIQALSLLYMFIRLKQSGLFSIGEYKKHYLPRKKCFKEISKQGLPASFNQFSMAIGIFITTFFLSKFGTAAVAAIGISMRVEQIAIMPAIGLNMAVIALVGQNNGARQFNRVRKAIALCIKYGFTFTMSMAFFVFIFARNILSLFTADPEVLNIAVTATRIATLYIGAYIIYGVSISALQAMKKPYFALWGGLARQFLAPLIFFPLFAFTFGWGVKGIFWALFTIAWLTTGAVLVYLGSVFRKLPKDGKKVSTP